MPDVHVTVHDLMFNAISKSTDQSQINWQYHKKNKSEWMNCTDDNHCASKIHVSLI